MSLFKRRLSRRNGKVTRCTSAKPKGGLGSFEAESRAPKQREASLTIVAFQQAKLDTEASDFGSIEGRARTCKRGRELPGGRSEPKRWLLAGLDCSLAAKAGNSLMNCA